MTRSFALVLLVASCEKTSNHPSGGPVSPEGAVRSTAAATATATPAAKTAKSPRSQDELPTTAPSIALNNFAGELVAAQQMLDKDPHSVPALAALTSLYLMRGQIYGRLADYDLAVTTAERAMKLDPRSASAWLAHAAVRSRLHEFSAALADLDRAQKLGGDDVAVEIMQRRAAIEQATGKLSEARPVIEKLARMLPSLQTIGTLATLDVDIGDTEKAEREFNDALDHFREVSPFPLVWMWLQQANMWEGEGSPARAGELLAAAHERLPADVSVTSHLAGAQAARGQRDQAAALLRPLVASSDDPQYAAQLADVLGRSDEAKQLREQALRGYEQLLRRHPVAFADHAARLMLAAESTLPRALQLAELNLRSRQTAAAYALVIEAALANHDSARACSVATAAQKSVARSSELAWQSKRALAACDESRASPSAQLQRSKTRVH